MAVNGEHPIEIRDLSKHYPFIWKKGGVTALDNLDLTVSAGEVFGLLGPNGSGKSTTLKLLLGLIRPSAGEARLFGESVLDVASRRRIGFLPENPYFHKFLTGEETLHFYGRLCGVYGSELERRTDELLALVGLEQGRDRPLGTYSKGMLQRIGLAQSMIHDPELLLLDEPTAGVDPIGSREIRDLILRLKGMGKTIVLCSHLLEQVEEVCDRVAILHLGKKILEGGISELLSVQDLTTVTVRGWTPASEVDARRELGRIGLGVVAVETPRVTLEKLFLSKVEAEAKR